MTFDPQHRIGGRASLMPRPHPQEEESMGGSGNETKRVRWPSSAPVQFSLFSSFLLSLFSHPVSLLFSLLSSHFSSILSSLVLFLFYSFFPSFFSLLFSLLSLISYPFSSLFSLLSNLFCSLSSLSFFLSLLTPLWVWPLAGLFLWSCL